MHVGNPKFSIVVPAYNAARFLEATLASVAAQTERDWELLVVDDGSTDDTAAIAQRFAAADSRARVVPGGHRGVSAARNQGVRAARGRYIAFLDADDLWSPEKLARHAEHLQARPDLGISFSRVRFMTPEGRATGVVSTAPVGGLRRHDFLYGNPTSTCSTLVIRREALEVAGGFDESMGYAEDVELVLRVLCLTDWAIDGLDEPLTLYRTNSAGLSSRLEKMHDGWEAMIGKARVYAPGLVQAHYRPARAAHLRYLARRALRVGAAPRTGIALIREALATDWRIALRHPVRTLGVAAALCIRHAIASTSAFLKRPFA